MTDAILAGSTRRIPITSRANSARYPSDTHRSRVAVTPGSRCDSKLCAWIQIQVTRQMMIDTVMRVTMLIAMVATAPTRTRTVAYLRVSTDKQAEHGVSLEAQRSKVESYAALYDLDLVAIEVDAGESAKSLHRPALDRALATLRAGAAEALLVVKLDRLTRSVRDLCDLVDTYFRDGKLALMSVGEQVDTRSAAGRMVLNMLTVIGQWEREAIGERTSAAMQHKVARGEFIGGTAPYGYSVAADGETLAPVAGEQMAIAEARTLRVGGLSLRKVAELLDAKGFRARSGRRFAAEQVARMVAA